jgi:hypothetical protein
MATWKLTSINPGDNIHVRVSPSSTSAAGADAPTGARHTSDDQNAQHFSATQAQNISYVLCEAQKQFPYVDKVTVLEVVREQLQLQLQLQISHSRDQLLQAVTDRVAHLQIAKLFNEKHTQLYDTNIIMTTAGQILVAAALVMTLTFLAFTSAPGGSMPQGYNIPSAKFNESSSSLVYTSTPTGVVLAFWYMHSLAFFIAAATAFICLLVIIHTAPENETESGQAAIKYASWTLFFSAMCTLGAFSAAAMSVLPDVHAKKMLSYSWACGWLCW